MYKLFKKRGDTSELYMEKLVDNYDDIICRDSKKVMYQDFYTAETFYSYSGLWSERWIFNLILFYAW